MRTRDVLRTSLYILLPIVAVAGSVLLEYWVIGDERIRVQLGGNLNEVLKQTIELERQISQMLTGLGTAVIGAVGYYLKARQEPKAQTLRRRIFYLSVAVLASAALSIFFGQLWMAAIRDQLVHDYIDFSSSSIVWPERLQTGLFLSSLIWFALISLASEVVTVQATPTVQVASFEQIREFTNTDRLK